MSKISVVIAAFNEESKIGRTLDSVSWADEIIVVDGGSTDKTVSIAKTKGALVWARPNYPMLNKNKNFGFSKAKHDWILNIDADEVIPQDLKDEIKESVKNNPSVNGYWIPRKNIIFGKWIEHGLWWPDRQLRLFRKGKGAFGEKHIHEYIDVVGPTETLSTPYIHHNYETISQFIRKMDNIYTTNEVDNLLATGYKVRWVDAIRFPMSDFIKIYFAQGCYKDGLHGLVLSLLQSFYSLVVFAKLWERQGFPSQDISLGAIEGEFDKSEAETRYWVITSKINLAHNPIVKIILRLKRAIIRRLTPSNI